MRIAPPDRAGEWFESLKPELNTKTQSHKLMKAFERISGEIERVAREVVGSAFKIHIALGPGSLESVYQACMVHELHRRGFNVRTEVKVPISMKGCV